MRRRKRQGQLDQGEGWDRDWGSCLSAHARVHTCTGTSAQLWNARAGAGVSLVSSLPSQAEKASDSAIETELLPEPCPLPGTHISDTDTQTHTKYANMNTHRQTHTHLSPISSLSDSRPTSHHLSLLFNPSLIFSAPAHCFLTFPSRPSFTLTGPSSSSCLVCSGATPSMGDSRSRLENGRRF